MVRYLLLPSILISSTLTMPSGSFAQEKPAEGGSACKEAIDSYMNEITSHVSKIEAIQKLVNKQIRLVSNFKQDFELTESTLSLLEENPYPVDWSVTGRSLLTEVLRNAELVRKLSANIKDDAAFTKALNNDKSTNMFKEYLDTPTIQIDKLPSPFEEEAGEDIVKPRDNGVNISFLLDFPLVKDDFSESKKFIKLQKKISKSLDNRYILLIDSYVAFYASKSRDDYEKLLNALRINVDDEALKKSQAAMDKVLEECK